MTHVRADAAALLEQIPALKRIVGNKLAKAAKPANWTSLKRGIAICVAVAIAGLILSSALPPLVADQTDRAVVDAPATLLTAPISGEVTALSVSQGSRFFDQKKIADIVNKQVDRSTLIELETKHAETVESLAAARARKSGDVRYIAMLADQIAKQTALVETRYQSQIAQLTAEVGSAEAAMQERKLSVDRQTTLVARSIAAPQMKKAASQEYAAAGFQKEVAEAGLQQKQAELDSARNNVFVGEDVHDLATLIQKKRDMELDVERLDIEEAQLAAAAQDQIRPLDAERRRLASLEHSTVDTLGGGEILNVNASVGRHVTAGDTLARMIDCDASFVVAIFSSRQGADLTVGSRVWIDAGAAGTIGGTISEVLPKTSDKVDELYAVPFPQTERRELYALIHPDTPLRRDVATAGEQNRCDIGRWVTVTRANGWVPSMSVLWRSAARLFSPATQVASTSAPVLLRSAAE
jgi:multidrug resistance efflux pump